MAYVHLVLALALLEFLLFGLAVARARERYHVLAPATTGNQIFERYFRVHMNTLEQLVIFVPSLLLFARYVNAYVAAALGALFIVGRALYFRGYVQRPEQRHVGFLLGGIPTFALLAGALIGALRALLPL
jgi:glutathione S-transferase